MSKYIAYHVRREILSQKPKLFQVTAAKRSRLSVRTPAAGKRGVAKAGRGRRREESGTGGRGSDQVGSEEGPGVERIQYRWVIAGGRWGLLTYKSCCQ